MKYHVGAPLGKQGRTVYLRTRKICVASTRTEARLIMQALNNEVARTEKRDKAFDSALKEMIATAAPSPLAQTASQSGGVA